MYTPRRETDGVYHHVSRIESVNLNWPIELELERGSIGFHLESSRGGAVSFCARLRKTCSARERARARLGDRKSFRRAFNAWRGSRVSLSPNPLVRAHVSLVHTSRTFSNILSRPRRVDGCKVARVLSPNSNLIPGSRASGVYSHTREFGIFGCRRVLEASIQKPSPRDECGPRRKLRHRQ